MCSTYTVDVSKCEKDSRGVAVKGNAGEFMGEWLPYFVCDCPCGCAVGAYKCPIAWNCYTIPKEVGDKGKWIWCCIIPGIPMGGCGTVEKKEAGGILFEHGHCGPCHGGFFGIRGSWVGKGYMQKDGYKAGAPPSEEMVR